MTAGGVRIMPDLALEEVSPAGSAMLILPGGETWDAEGNGAALDAARAWVDAGVPVAAICGATAGLARAGLLDRRRHTSNAAMYIESTGYAGLAHYHEVRAVTSEDGLVITAASMWPLEFAYEIFRRLDVYEPAPLEAWYGLFSTGDPQYFARMMELEQARQG
jgi:putative intracellular protease/amidase